VAYWLLQNGITVMIAACDTFRSGAVEQLKTHCARLQVCLGCHSRRWLAAAASGVLLALGRACWRSRSAVCWPRAAAAMAFVSMVCRPTVPPCTACVSVPQVPLYERGYEKDPAKVAYEASKAAQRAGIDVLLVDTAGRMQVEGQGGEGWPAG
jgi:signal recognition particle GTPase